MRKKSEITKLHDKIWECCKQITRIRYGNTCYTCGATNLIGSNWHTGHGKPKSILPLRYKYDLRNLRPQCMPCNKHHGGQSDIFIAKLQKEKDGLAFLQEACYQDRKTGHWEVSKKEPLMGSAESKKFLQSLLEKLQLTLQHEQSS